MNEERTLAWQIELDRRGREIDRLKVELATCVEQRDALDRVIGDVTKALAAEQRRRKAAERQRDRLIEVMADFDARCEIEPAESQALVARDLAGQAQPAPAERREELGYIAFVECLIISGIRDHANKAYWCQIDDRSRETYRRIADAVAAAIQPQPPQPEAIVQTAPGVHHAFERWHDGKAYYDAPEHRDQFRHCLVVNSWIWHPAIPTPAISNLKETNPKETTP